MKSAIHGKPPFLKFDTWSNGWHACLNIPKVVTCEMTRE